MKTIGYIGAYPPPAGGNSVHIERLCNAFAEKQIRCLVFDPYSSEPINSPNSYIRIKRYAGGSLASILKVAKDLQSSKLDVVHMHVSAMGKFSFVAPLILAACPKKAKKVITIHSGSFIQNYLSYPSYQQWLINQILKRFDHIIAVGIEQRDFIRQQLANAFPASSVIPAYLPPKAENTPVTKALEEKLRNNAKPILVSSGYGVPLYGYEKIAQAFNYSDDLAKHYQILICLYNTYEDVYVRQIEQQLSPFDVTFARDLSANEFAYLLKQCEVYVRATDRDGDAVAIREANHYNLNVVASTAIARPDFCELFDREDTASLVQAINKATQSLTVTSNSDNNPINQIEKIYFG